MNTFMDDYASHIIAIAHKNNIQITNMSLQKVMYFVFKYYLVNNGKDYLIERLYEDEKFVASAYGPMVRDIYNKYSVYGSLPITASGEEFDDFSGLNFLIVKYLKEDPFSLVKKAQAESFWKNNYDKNDDHVYYELRDIERD